MMTPARRSRKAGSTACIIASVPSVLVSNRVRTVLGSTSSTGEGTPKAAIVDQDVNGAGFGNCARDTDSIGHI